MSEALENTVEHEFEDERVHADNVRVGSESLTESAMIREIQDLEKTLDATSHRLAALRHAKSILVGTESVAPKAANGTNGHANGTTSAASANDETEADARPIAEYIKHDDSYGEDEVEETPPKAAKSAKHDVAETPEGVIRKKSIDRVLEAFSDGFEHTVPDLSEKLGLSVVTTRANVIRLVKELKKIKKVGHGVYRAK